MTDAGATLDLEAILGLMPFAASTGVKLDSATPTEVVGWLSWAPELCTVGDAMHGGAIMALTDSVGAVCAYLNLPREAATATISSTTTFLRAVRSGNATATARPLHIGRSTFIVQTDVRDDNGRLVAQTTQAQAVLGPPTAG